MTINSDLVSSVFLLNKFYTYNVSKADLFYIFTSPINFTNELYKAILLKRKSIVGNGPLLQFVRSLLTD